MNLSVGTIVDLVLAVIFLIAIVRGWHVGFAYQVAKFAALVAAGIVAYVLAASVGMPLLSGLFFVIAFVLFLQLLRIVKLVDKIPVIGTLDKAGGAVAGFFAVFVIFCVLFHLLVMAVPQEIWNGWGLTREEVDKTYLLQVFLRYSDK